MTRDPPSRAAGSGLLVRRAAPLALAEKMIRHPGEVPSHGSDCSGRVTGAERGDQRPVILLILQAALP